MSRAVVESGEIEIRVNGAARRVAAAFTIADLIAELGRQPRLVAVERNGEIAPRTGWDAIRLEPGDRLEIVQFVQGG